MRSRSVEWKNNLVKMLERLEYIKQLPKQQTESVCLHVGCGKNILDGFINIDKYYDDSRVINCDMYKLPQSPNSISAIYSSHALEHLPIRRAKMCIENWYSILKQKGVLYLAIPDLEEIMHIFLDPNVPDNAKEYWYMYTLFGYQADCSDLENAYRNDIPVDPGQFHTCGFSKKSISKLLTDNGFVIQDIYNYDGYATPSIWVEAKK
jgi:hypothetical protein